VTRRDRVAVCIPARNEAGTIGSIVGALARHQVQGEIYELVVVDDGSSDATARIASRAGATVVPSVGGPGKGQAMRTAVAATESELLVFLDADVTNFVTSYVPRLVAPLRSQTVQFVKGRYLRSCHGVSGDGGRVTELLAKPLLRHLHPELSDVAQPLAGETAVRRTALDDIAIADGYGAEIGLLIDMFERFGRVAIAEVDLGERVHRNRPLRELRTQADEVLAETLARQAVFMRTQQ
jgi:glucosyl-3-phosphoglycerate synthase